MRGPSWTPITPLTGSFFHAYPHTAFTTAFRAAIWQAHKMRCAYTGEPIPFSSVEIDHIITVHVDPKELAKLIENGVVPSSFDLNGLENLLPTSRFQNGRKSDTLRGTNVLVHFLDVAASMVLTIQQSLHQMEVSDRTLRGYLMLKAQAEQNDLDVDEVIDIKRQEVEGLTRVSEAPDVDEGAGVYLLNAALATDLLAKRLAIGGGDIHEVKLQNDDNVERLCSTCTEFLAAKDAGFWPRTAYDMSCFAMADRTCETLRAITKARYAPASGIRYPKIDCEDLDRWSSEWAQGLFQGGNIEEDKLFSDFPTLNDLAEAEYCKMTLTSKIAFEVEAGWAAFRFTEIFRADVNGSGEEDIIGFGYFRATEGTLRAGSMCVARLDAKDGLIHRLPIEAAYSPGLKLA